MSYFPSLPLDPYPALPGKSEEDTGYQIDHQLTQVQNWARFIGSTIMQLPHQLAKSGHEFKKIKKTVTVTGRRDSSSEDARIESKTPSLTASFKSLVRRTSGSSVKKGQEPSAIGSDSDELLAPRLSMAQSSYTASIHEDPKPRKDETFNLPPRYLQLNFNKQSTHSSDKD